MRVERVVLVVSVPDLNPEAVVRHAREFSASKGYTLEASDHWLRVGFVGRRPIVIPREHICWLEEAEPTPQTTPVAVAAAPALALPEPRKGKSK